MLTDDALAADLARRAGELLLRIRDGGPRDDPKALGRAGDHESNEFLLACLAELRPHDAVLSEESADDPSRLTAARVWIVDPLDGTKEFTLPGRDDWAVHVALYVAGEGIAAAAVAVPVRGEVWSTGDVPRVRHERRDRPRVVVSASRPPEFAGPVADAMDGELVPMGSAGAKAMAVVRGDADAYVHAGGQWEWDSAAPVGVALAAGLTACRIDGSPLRYNQPRPYLPDLVICRPELARPVLAAIAGVGSAVGLA
ncbi:MAG TPA: 3'(2'),5'-bisphosphate nucleotidase CysQ [Pseudonocardiaceae bacterium]|nr:3'(2'),5'-bisphosphate nucleotidase CysQ [Pseudonocardiaceae bacterium]